MGMNRKLKKAKLKTEKSTGKKAKAENKSSSMDYEKLLAEMEELYLKKESEKLSTDIQKEFSVLPEEVTQEILFRVKNIWNRIIDKSGGAFYDLPNFCVKEDFDWLNDMIKQDFDSIRYDFDEEICHNSKLEEYLVKENYDMLQEIDYKKDDIIENATENIYTYIITEERPIYKSKEGLKRLEDNFIEKRVVSSREELYNLESYISALQYVQNLNE